MPHINWKSVSYIINYYLTQWTDNRMPDKRGTDNRGSTVLNFKSLVFEKKKKTVEDVTLVCATLCHLVHFLG